MSSNARQIYYMVIDIDKRRKQLLKKKNSDGEKFIWGNSFLHPLYGTEPTWLVGHSYFNFDKSRLQDIYCNTDNRKR